MQDVQRNFSRIDQTIFLHYTYTWHIRFAIVFTII